MISAGEYLLLATVLLCLLHIDRAGGAMSGVAAVPRFDVAVYDATSGGVMAAVAAARRGHSVLLMCASWPACFPEGGRRIGGMSSGGLGQSDIGGSASEVIGGLAEEFYTRNRAHYGNSAVVAGLPTSNPAAEGTIAAAAAAVAPAALDLSPTLEGDSCRLPSAACNVTYNLEPHVALSIFIAMLQDANVTVW